MYRKDTEGWFKHYDFILFDMLCLQIAFLLGYCIRHGLGNPYTKDLYLGVAVYLELADVTVLVFAETLRNVLKRGMFQEVVKTLQHVFLIGLLSTFYLFVLQEGGSYSRVSFYWMLFFYFLLTISIRFLWKARLQKVMYEGGEKSLLLITSYTMIEEVLHNLKEKNFKRFRISGVVVVDRDDIAAGDIEGIPFVSNDKVTDYVCREWVDDVLVALQPSDTFSKDLREQLLQTGVTVHYKIDNIYAGSGRQCIVEQIGDYDVVTYSGKFITFRQMVFKRLMDILGGLLGCLLTVVIFLFVAPLIYIQSPGPVFFSQTRVGKNGKKFRMYKFRSMYLDAEKRKEELMAQNRVKDGRMFKMEFDPRVIGNKVLPDGTTKKGIGQFIRDTSLDEFPQFFNVLLGDMSLVGTRPPTVDEWERYELHHRARLATKPGITGLWQVSGRSEILDFEDVVKLDTEYINTWSPGLDIKILLKTVLVVLKREGSM